MFKKSGLQYINTICDDVVVKSRLPFCHVVTTHLRWNKSLIHHPLQLIMKSMRSYRLTRSRYETLKNRPDIHDIFRIIAFEKNRVFQEPVTPVRAILTGHFPSDKNLIDDYFAFVIYLFKRGLFEYSFNVFDNFGVDRAGRFCLIDIGEFSFDRESLLHKVRRGECLPYSLKPFKNNDSIIYFTRRSESTFAESTILDMWHN
jgi:hypothetical protein